MTYDAYPFLAEDDHDNLIDQTDLDLDQTLFDSFEEQLDSDDYDRITDEELDKALEASLPSQ